MKKVYAVNSGWYSDYRVIALFTTKELAAEFMAAVPDSDYNEIEEYELDSNAPDLIRRGYLIWRVLMLRDGTCERAHPKEVNAYSVGEVGHRIWERTKAQAYRDGKTPDCLKSTVWAKSEEHAVKIANEQRAQMIAMGEWA